MTRVRWRDGSALVAGLRVEVSAGPYSWIASIAVDGMPWHSWHGTERDARRAAVAMARKLATR